MKRLDLTKAGVHPDLVAKMREWESIPAAERIALEVAPLCPHGTADPAVCPDCLTPAEQRIDPLELMRIPPEFRDARMSDLPKLLLDKLGPYLASWPPARAFLWMGGNVGAGKTHAACAVLKHLHANRGVTGRFWGAGDVADGWRTASASDYEGPWTAERLDNALMLAPVLVLDDVGAERATDFTSGKFYRVIDARWREQRPTIITTNVPADALDPRIRSRLLSGVQVTFKGQDRRIQ